MHICFIYPGYPPETMSGGIGTYIYETVEALKELDVKITIISRSEKYKDKIEKLYPNVRLLRIGESQLAKADYYKLFRYGGYKQLCKKIVIQVNKLNRVHPIDIIECCDWGSDGYELLNQFKDKIILRCHTPSFVSESYNPLNPPYLSEIIKKQEKKFIKEAKFIISPSKSLINEFKKHLKIKGKIFIEPYLINHDNIKRKDNNDLSDNIKTLIVGRIEQRKGQHIAIKAIEVLNNKGVNITLDMYGADTSVNKIKCSDLILNEITGIHRKKIKYKGELSRERLLKIYCKYDFYLAASLFDNYPFTVLESMAAGLPVIGNNYSGIKEQIIDKKNGLLYNGSPEDLANKIYYLISNNILRNKIAKNSINYIINNNSPSIISKNILKRYRQICMTSNI